MQVVAFLSNQNFDRKDNDRESRINFVVNVVDVVTREHKSSDKNIIIKHLLSQTTEGRGEGETEELHY